MISPSLSTNCGNVFSGCIRLQKPQVLDKVRDKMKAHSEEELVEKLVHDGRSL